MVKAVLVCQFDMGKCMVVGQDIALAALLRAVFRKNLHELWEDCFPGRNGPSKKVCLVWFSVCTCLRDHGELVHSPLLNF
jgi:hypothetical protein